METNVKGGLLRRSRNVCVAVGGMRYMCHQLVEKEYGIKSYSTQRTDRFEMTRHILYVELCGQPVATVSVVPDSDLGLPGDCVFRDKIDHFRESGYKVAEVGALAKDGSLTARGSQLAILHLFSEVLRYSIKNEIEFLCITVNPLHKKFYEFLGFCSDHEVRIHPSVTAPAVFLWVDVGLWLKQKLQPRATKIF